MTLLILDTETTSLDGYIVQLGIIDMTGAVMLDTLVNPRAEVSPGALQIHGLTAEQLADAPCFEEIEPRLLALIEGRWLVVYNAAFDRDILRNEIERMHGVPVDWSDPPAREILDRARATATEWLGRACWSCAMRVYARWYGDWSDYHGGYRWQPLRGGDHTAVGDCRATLKVLQTMAESGEAGGEEVYDDDDHR